MPLFELFGDAKRKPRATDEKPTSISADQSFPPENELVELWQNGQVMMQGQSSLAKKNHSPYISCSLPPYSLPKKDKDLSTGQHSGSSVKLRPLDSSMNEFHMSAPLGEMCLSSDEDVVPWFDYPIDENLRNDFCSDLLPELSGVTANEPSKEDFNTMKRGGCSNHVYRDSNISSFYSSLDRENSSKSSLAAVSEAMGLGTSCSPAGQTQFPSLRSRQASENTGTSTSNRSPSRDPGKVKNSAVGFSSEKLRKQNPGPSTNHNSFLNFSHFSRPAALYKSTIGNNCVIADSDPTNLERDGFKQKDSFPDVKTVKSNSGPMREIGSDCQFVEKQATATASLEAKPTEELPFKESEGIGQAYAANGDELNHDSGGASMSKEPLDAVQPVVASSVCSGNGVDSLSDDPPRNLKRKGCSSNCESEALSEDVEEDSVDLRKSTSARGSGSKRSRAAEVHNLSERKRRDRINEKMRALQELVPNSNKVDKASMLDEAIDYLKTLQLQVQIMSMGAGLCMPPMMLPAHMAQFSPISAGMAAGLGFGMGMANQNGGPTACPMLQFPPMQGAHFPCPIMSGHQALHGMPASNFPVMGLPSQGLPLSMLLVPPLVPFPGGSHLGPPAGLDANIQAGLVENTDAALASSSKEVAENINGAGCSVNHISSQARNGGFDRPEGRAITSATAQRDYTEPSKAAREVKPA